MFNFLSTETIFTRNGFCRTGRNETGAVTRSIHAVIEDPWPIKIAGFVSLTKIESGTYDG